MTSKHLTTVSSHAPKTQVLVDRMEYYVNQYSIGGYGILCFFCERYYVTSPNLKKNAMDALIPSLYVTELAAVTDAL